MDSGLYHINDMVRTGCNDCKGCSDCCMGMGESIVLDPYDIWQLERNLNITFAELMQDKIELHVEAGIVLPNLKMKGSLECCGFLNEDGRCGIHEFRPGLCRLFPLGRKYENNELVYFVLEDACIHTDRTKVKVKKWLGVANAGRYESFLIRWHNLRKELQEKLETCSDELAKEINMGFLNIFYVKKYGQEDFFGQFEERMKEFANYL